MGGSLTKSSLYDIVLRRHKRIVLNLFSKFGYHNYNIICKRYSLLKVIDIYKYNLGSLVYKLMFSESPLDLYDWLKKEPGHENIHFTRSEGNFAIPFPRVNAVKFGYIYNSILTWNNLSKDVREINGINKFKRLMKSSFIDSYIE